MPSNPVNLNSATFVISAHLQSQWPDPELPEVAFAGRSNVGKSSAINAITNHRGLAKTSKTPGRTQQIVFFDLATEQRLVDLPGYGFAKVPLNVRRHWEESIANFLKKRQSLRALILPMDSRRPLTPLDQQMLDWCLTNELPVHILLTKADKLSNSQAKTALLSVKKTIQNMPDVSVQLFSVLKKVGLEEARSVIIDFLGENY
ncbi:MAG: GTP-binding protein [Parasphingorhabdus sp.]|jgi:GTP-binding protein